MCRVRKEPATETMWNNKCLLCLLFFGFFKKKRKRREPGQKALRNTNILGKREQLKDRNEKYFTYLITKKSFVALLRAVWVDV